jgi:hypothetical protein
MRIREGRCRRTVYVGTRRFKELGKLVLYVLLRQRLEHSRGEIRGRRGCSAVGG